MKKDKEAQPNKKIDIIERDSKLTWTLLKNNISEYFPQIFWYLGLPKLLKESSCREGIISKQRISNRPKAFFLFAYKLKSNVSGQNQYELTKEIIYIYICFSNTFILSYYILPLFVETKAGDHLLKKILRLALNQRFL